MLQYAADIASNRNGQHLSASSLQHRWKHDIQIALLRRSAGIINRALHLWGRPRSRPGDHDLDDSETDTALPDDDNDTVPLASYTYESVWPSSLSTQ